MARMEAEHAHETVRRVLTKGLEPPTPDEGPYSHLPLQVRTNMEKVSEWILTEEGHLDVSKFLAVERNARIPSIAAKFAKDSHMSFTSYFNETQKCKHLTQ